MAITYSDVCGPPPTQADCGITLFLEIRADFTDRPPRFWVGMAVSAYFLEKGIDFFSKVRSVSRTGAIIPMLSIDNISCAATPG